MLRDFTLQAASSPFVWGWSDCVMTIADWWQINHGVDPAADLRGTYHSEEECNAMLVERGGIAMMIGDALRPLGARPAYSERPGDIGVIDVHGRVYGAWLGDSGRWLVKGRTGVAGFRAPRVLMVWSI